MEGRLERLAERVQYLEDLEAIRYSWRDYCTRLDSEDWEGLGDVFAKDGILEMVGLDALAPGLDGTYRGRHSIIEDFYKPAVVGVVESSLFYTGHLSTNMQIDLRGDEATTLAYFFEIVANRNVIIGTYQHRMRREEERWRFLLLRISVRYHAKLEASEFGGQSLQEVLARPF